ncbi:MAG TPA: chorismate-binding protein, partial [Thermoleophilia bacterium]|nr:chorismate-binding protein [Thermoleophilia bacterium]
DALAHDSHADEAPTAGRASGSPTADDPLLNGPSANDPPVGDASVRESRDLALPPLPPVELQSDYPADEFIAGVDEVQERIRAGWVYQVNLSHRFRFAAHSLDPLACYERLRVANPSPFMGIIEGGADGPADGAGEGSTADGVADGEGAAGIGPTRTGRTSGGAAGSWAVVSNSPERLFNVVDGVMTARPIAGTRPRGATPAEDEALEAELRASRKEQAEHVMLVDLLRNDLSRVCDAGTVEVSEAFTVERYSHVMHLVSQVRGLTGASLSDCVRAVFPGGTITGAPKESVMREIARLEPVARGAYTGSLGYVSGAGCDFNILIRTFTFADGVGYVSGGGGDVIESDAAEEYLETRHKVEALLHVLGRGRGGHEPAPPVVVRSWRPPRPRASYDAGVLFVEAHDSFSFNIVNYLRMLGAQVTVIDHEEDPERHLRADDPDRPGPTHVVVGPGPGDPTTSGRLLDWVTAVLARRLPFLGICLGHQALGMVLGATLDRAPRPVHGEDHPVVHDGSGPFAGLPSPASFTRYHSLHLVDLPSELRVCGRTFDGLVMAVAHRHLPAWGVQFHPESMLSPRGLDLLANFLELGAGGPGVPTDERPGTWW